MVNAMVIEEKDNVAVVIEPVGAGEAVCWTGRDGKARSLQAAQDIIIYHKVALRPIAKGERAVKYGEPIGVALSDIAPGEHVHTHNLASEAEEGSQG